MPASERRDRNKKRKTMRIKDVRQGLHTVLHTQGRGWTGCYIYITASKNGAVPCCCACYVPRPDG